MAMIRTLSMRGDRSAFSYKEISEQLGIPGAFGFSVFHGRIAPGEKIPSHVHPAGTETVVFVTRGTVKHIHGRCLEKDAVNRKGDFVYIPAGVPHVPTNIGGDGTDVDAVIVCDYDQNDRRNALLYVPPTNGDGSNYALNYAATGPNNTARVHDLDSKHLSRFKRLSSQVQQSELGQPLRQLLPGDSRHATSNIVAELGARISADVRVVHCGRSKATTFEAASNPGLLLFVWRGKVAVEGIDGDGCADGTFIYVPPGQPCKITGLSDDAAILQLQRAVARTAKL